MKEKAAKTERYVVHVDEKKGGNPKCRATKKGKKTTKRLKHTTDERERRSSFVKQGEVRSAWVRVEKKEEVEHCPTSSGRKRFPWGKKEGKKLLSAQDGVELAAAFEGKNRHGRYVPETPYLGVQGEERRIVTNRGKSIQEKRKREMLYPQFYVQQVAEGKDHSIQYPWKGEVDPRLGKESETRRNSYHAGEHRKTLFPILRRNQEYQVSVK